MTSSLHYLLSGGGYLWELSYWRGLRHNALITWHSRSPSQNEANDCKHAVDKQIEAAGGCKSPSAGCDDQKRILQEGKGGLTKAIYTSSGRKAGKIPVYYLYPDGWEWVEKGQGLLGRLISQCLHWANQGICDPVLPDLDFSEAAKPARRRSWQESEELLQACQEAIEAAHWTVDGEERDGEDGRAEGGRERSCKGRGDKVTWTLRNAPWVCVCARRRAGE